MKCGYKDNKTVKTNIGKYVSCLQNKHFPSELKFRKIFNRNMSKLAYSCMSHLKSTENHNQNVIFQDQPQMTAKTCNCRKKELPINGSRLGENLFGKK